MDPADIPYDIINRKENLFAAITEFGGHVGFMSSKRHFWAEHLAVKFVHQHAQEKTNL